MEFTSKEIAKFRQSWEESRSETQRFLEAVSGLSAHDARKSIEIHEQRHLLERLSAPLVEALRMIQLNQKDLLEHRERVRKASERAGELARELYKPEVSACHGRFVRLRSDYPTQLGRVEVEMQSMFVQFMQLTSTTGRAHGREEPA